MDKKYQVFLSSTYTDLIEERRSVSDALSKAGYIVQGMELFSASDEDQLKYIERIIDVSDYYVLIVGARYGSIDSDGVSYTEREFEYAVSRKIPVLAFLHQNPVSLAQDKSDMDSAKLGKLNLFREKLRQGRLLDFWNNAGDLCTKVVISVGQFVNINPGTGWVRGDNILNPNIVNTLEDLRKENELLKEKLTENANENNSDKFAFEDEYIEYSLEIGTLYKVPLVRGDIAYTENEFRKKSNCSLRIKWDILFKEIFQILYKEPSTIYVSSLIKKFVKNEHQEIAEMEIGNFEKLFFFIQFQFETINMIELISKNSSKGFHNLHWKLTPKAKAYIADQYAQKKILEDVEKELSPHNGKESPKSAVEKIVQV